MARLEKLDEQIKKKDDEIEKARENLKRKENQKKRLLSKQKEVERNQRTKRLIERGAILENVIGDATDFSNEQIQSILFEVFSVEVARAKVEKMRAKTEEKAEIDQSLAEFAEVRDSIEPTDKMPLIDERLAIRPKKRQRI